MKIKPPAGVPLPPKFKHRIELEFSRRFPWKERLKILIGYTAIIEVGIVTEHHTGHFTPAMKLTLTEHLQPKKTPPAP